MTHDDAIEVLRINPFVRVQNRAAIGVHQMGSQFRCRFCNSSAEEHADSSYGVDECLYMMAQEIVRSPVVSIGGPA